MDVVLLPCLNIKKESRFRDSFLLALALASYQVSEAMADTKGEAIAGRLLRDLVVHVDGVNIGTLGQIVVIAK